MQPSQTNVVVQTTPRGPDPSTLVSPRNNIISNFSPEQVKLYERLMDSEAMFMNKLTRLLYNAELIKSNTIDMDSPIAGFTLAKHGFSEDPKKNQWKPNINFTGYLTVTNTVLLLTSDAMSSTKLDSDKFDLGYFCYTSTLSVTDMITSNREKWEFTDPMLIVDIGLCIWINVYSIASRSMSKNGSKTALDRILDPHVFDIPGNTLPEQKKPLVRWPT